PYKCVHNALLAHGTVVKLFRSKNIPAPIGIIHDGSYNFPLTDCQADRDAAERANMFYYGWVVHPIWIGDYPPVMKTAMGSLLPSFTPDEVAMIKGSADFYSYDAYTSQWATPSLECDPKNTSSPDWPSCVSTTQTKNNMTIGPSTQSSWNFLVPQGLHDSLVWLYKTFQFPEIIISENGMARKGENDLTDLAALLDDGPRVEWYLESLKAVKTAIEVDKVPLTGFVYWSCMDNFEWSDGYASRFGVTYVNYTSPDKARTIKKSGHFLNDVFSGRVVL
ncbi:hypothetical protein HDU76_004263, partial [Blyttiomyces sp. JEL0837]